MLKDDEAMIPIVAGEGVWKPNSLCSSSECFGCKGV